MKFKFLILLLLCINNIFSTEISSNELPKKVIDAAKEANSENDKIIKDFIQTANLKQTGVILLKTLVENQRLKLIKRLLNTNKRIEDPNKRFVIDQEVLDFVEDFKDNIDEDDKEKIDLVLDIYWLIKGKGKPRKTEPDIVIDG